MEFLILAIIFLAIIIIVIGFLLYILPLSLYVLVTQYPKIGIPIAIIAGIFFVFLIFAIITGSVQATKKERQERDKEKEIKKNAERLKELDLKRRLEENLKRNAEESIKKRKEQMIQDEMTDHSNKRFNRYKSDLEIKKVIELLLEKNSALQSRLNLAKSYRIFFDPYYGSAIHWKEKPYALKELTEMRNKALSLLGENALNSNYTETSFFSLESYRSDIVRVQSSLERINNEAIWWFEEMIYKVEICQDICAQLDLYISKIEAISIINAGLGSQSNLDAFDAVTFESIKIMIGKELFCSEMQRIDGFSTKVNQLFHDLKRETT